MKWYCDHWIQTADFRAGEIYYSLKISEGSFVKITEQLIDGVQPEDWQFLIICDLVYMNENDSWKEISKYFDFVTEAQKYVVDILDKAGYRKIDIKFLTLE